MGVADDDLVCACRGAALEDGVEVRAHVGTGALRRRALPVRVRLRDHPTDAFQVDGDEQLHEDSLQSPADRAAPAQPPVSPTRRARAATSRAVVSRSSAWATSKGECM